VRGSHRCHRLAFGMGQARATMPSRAKFDAIFYHHRSDRDLTSAASLPPELERHPHQLIIGRCG
jgi:hypothetical protein